MTISEDGRFRLLLNGSGGGWQDAREGILLRPDAGGELILVTRDWGYELAEDPLAEDSPPVRFSLGRTEAQFRGFWHDFDPRNPLYRAFNRCCWRIASPYGNLDALPDGEDWDAVISGENMMVTVGGDRLRWAFGDRWGYARRVIGTRRIDSPRALSIPHFYDYWGRLGDWRPGCRTAEPGISFLASNLGQPGTLAARRLAVAVALSKWFTVAIPPHLVELFPPDAKIKAVDVPRTPRAKYEFVSGYTFNLCFENSKAPGYLTEKLFDALICGSVPVYDGDPEAWKWIDPAGLLMCDGLDACEIADLMRDAQCDGTVELVQEKRENLIRVSLSEMVSRVEEFCGLGIL